MYFFCFAFLNAFFIIVVRMNRTFALIDEELCLAIKIVCFVIIWELAKMLFRRLKVAVSLAQRTNLLYLDGFGGNVILLINH